MEDPRTSLGQLKKRLYTIALSFALAGAMLGLVVGEVVGSNSTFTRGLLGVVILFEVLAIILVRRQEFIRVVEELTYVVLSVMMVSVFAFSLYLAESPAVMQVSLFSYYIWLPIVYVLVFVFHDGRGR